MTINNPTNEDKASLCGLEVEYMIVGREHFNDPDKTPHFQCYIRWKNAKTFSRMKKLFPRAHLKVARGTDKDNKKYCSKEEVLIEKGEASEQGSRNDLKGIIDMVQQNPSMDYIIDNVSSLQAIRTAEKILVYREPRRSWKTEIYWFHGSTETGKSRRAYELFPDAYTAMDTGQWWEGYDGEEAVIIDDMRRDFLKFHQLLKLFDRYPYRVEVKGGSRQFLAKTIVVTSCYSPEVMFDTRDQEDIQQLLRRITEIKSFDTI
jgi:hypothetical protein